MSQESLKSIRAEDMKDQINEYHLMVAEVLSALDAQLVKMQSEIQALTNNVTKAQSDEARAEISALKSGQQVLQLELARTMAKLDSLKEYVEQGFNQLWKRLNDK